MNNAFEPFAATALTQYFAWFEKVYQIPADSETWNKQQLEYQFECVAPEFDNEKTRLIADEYYSGSLDWYSFDVEGNQPGGLNAGEANVRSTEVFSIIPSEVRFGGMPSPRWWEFEDCLLYTSPSPRDLSTSRMPSSA